MTIDRRVLIILAIGFTAWWWGPYVLDLLGPVWDELVNDLQEL